MRSYAEQMAIPALSNQITNSRNSYYGAFKDNIRPCSLGTIMEGLASVYHCSENEQLKAIIFKESGSTTMLSIVPIGPPACTLKTLAPMIFDA